MLNSLYNFLFCPAVSAPIELKPLSLKFTRCLTFGDWMITQKFEKLGREITVIAFGYDWHDAQENFKLELEQEKYYAS